jgi:hypothetical protein
MILDSFEYGSRKIEFYYHFSTRKTIGITVFPDLRVFVNIPESATLEIAKDKLRKKASWIFKQLDFFLAFHPLSPSKKFISGESHLYLGRQYRLKVITSEYNKIRLFGGFIELHTTGEYSNKELIESWYYLQAVKKFEEIAAPWVQRFQKYSVSPKAIHVKEMTYRWGSCSSQGNILLNPELIKAPKPCIEYVMVHELCHLVHLNHNRKFFELQSREMPDWEKWKARLEKLMA